VFAPVVADLCKEKNKAFVKYVRQNKSKYDHCALHDFQRRSRLQSFANKVALSFESGYSSGKLNISTYSKSTFSMLCKPMNLK